MHLNYVPGALSRPDIMFTGDVDYTIGKLKLQPLAPDTQPRVAGCWKFYKELKSYALDNDQILILIRLFVLNQTVRQVKEEMGWTSTKTYYARYRAALETLKRRGYRQ